jgi:putative transposase
VATHLRTELVLEALDMALVQRLPKDVIHHSDHGSQYTSLAFGRRCELMGVRPSLGSVGDAYDNAMCESFFGTLEAELLDRYTFRSQVDARMALFRYIKAWYNPRRRHSSLGYRSPVEFERQRSEASDPAPGLDRPVSSGVSAALVLLPCSAGEASDSLGWGGVEPTH